MPKPGIQEKGIVLFIALATIFMVILLANIVLSIVSSQSRLTHHRVSRIQAYYAALAGVNFSLEQLRTGVWAFTPTNSCPDPGGCLLTNFVQDYAGTFPTSVSEIKIIFCPSGSTCTGTSDACSPPTGYTFCINSTATFTYTP
ncbi:MAG: hypothetical protein WC723_03105 [Candidatus Omnitrophota bacterium]